MRLVELITIWATFVGALLTGIAAVEQRLINRIRNSSYYSGNKSKELSKLHLISKWRLYKFQKLKIIVETKNGNYQVDEDKYSQLRKNRVFIVVIFLIVSISLIVIFH